MTTELDRTARLATEAIIFAAVGELDATRDRTERARIVAAVVFFVFNDYYQRSRAIPFAAQRAFERRDWPAMFPLSRERLSIYARSVEKLGAPLKTACPELAEAGDAFWSEVEAEYLTRIRGRYEADLAFAFLYSVRRKAYQDEWRPVAYSCGTVAAPRASLAEPVLLTFQASLPLDANVIEHILDIPRFKVPWRDRAGDARLVAEEISAALVRQGIPSGTDVRLVMANAGFYRNRGAYLVGRINVPGHGLRPLAIALLNGPDGIFADAALVDSDELQWVFSSTLANFHVTSPHYHELAQLLFSLMPKRPLGTHYSTIGFNHVGKVAVINEIARESKRTGERLDTAVGFRGTVAIGFSMPSSRYVMKIIRDKPTAGYKWGHFDGVDAVLDKYRLVHDIDRAGSMLDNIIYYNIRLDAGWFAPELLAELEQAAPRTVVRHGDNVVFKHLIVQMKMIPLPVFLSSATVEQARAAVVGLGDCIKNNTAAGVFNKDLDGRNYGVSPIGKVYLFDYDAVEPLAGVKIRTNVGREDGEEDVPDWVFEEGTVFLPEEMMTGLRIDDRGLRRVFMDAHGDLMTTGYWEGMQRALTEGRVPKVRSYPQARRLSAMSTAMQAVSVGEEPLPR